MNKLEGKLTIGEEVLPFEMNGTRKVFQIGSDLSTADPFRYGRAVSTGDKKEAERMRNTKMITISWEF